MSQLFACNFLSFDIYCFRFMFTIYVILQIVLNSLLYNVMI